MGKYDINAHVLGTCIKYCTNASPLGKGGTYVWRPNITGSVSGSTSVAGIVTGGGDAISSGAFSSQRKGNATSFDGTGNSQFTLFINAHNSNVIYTDNGKIYPQSLALNFIIKA